ncbi:hypothetical protein HZA98_04995 [Candidatus Woesearchaeota archaeon]|nr:hypothetical protein [Candidatus Woesearchaeota archaeon]
MVKKIKKNEGRIYSIIGLICGIIGLIVAPVIFGPVALILGLIARKKGDKKFGLWVAILGGLDIVLSIIIFIYLLSILPSYLSTAPA